MLKTRDGSDVLGLRVFLPGGQPPMEIDGEALIGFGAPPDVPIPIVNYRADDGSVRTISGLLVTFEVRKRDSKIVTAERRPLG